MKALLDTYRERVNFTSFREFLKRISFSGGNGYDGKIKLIYDAYQEQRDFDGKQIDEHLNEFLLSYSLFSNKANNSFSFNTGEIDSIIDIIKDRDDFHDLLNNQEGLYALKGNALKRVPVSKPVLSAIVEETDYMALFFRGKELKTWKEDIDLSRVKNPEGYNKVIGYWEEVAQYCDVVIIDKSNSEIDFCIDLTKGPSPTKIYDRMRNLRAVFIENFNFNQNLFALNAVNHFTTIQKHYEGSNGVVLSMDFKTDETGNYISNNMVGLNKDLRKETFQTAGSTAIGGKFTPFSIGVRFPSVMNKGAYLDRWIPGTKSVIQMPSPVSQYVVNFGVESIEDYLYLKVAHE